MELSGYTTIMRQSGLMSEMEIIAHNIANANTAGFRKEGLLFSEHVVVLENGPSLSMSHANVKHIDMTQGELGKTGGTYDLAIQGEGFFMLQTPNGQRLTRTGSFTPAADGSLVSVDGHPVLDSGGAPILLPLGASKLSISQDGTMSVNGEPTAQIGVWVPQDATTLKREGGTLFSAEGYNPGSDFTLHQGFIENSNVNPITEITRMIQVQRAYELGQSFLENENERKKVAIQTLGR